MNECKLLIERFYLYLFSIALTKIYKIIRIVENCLDIIVHVNITICTRYMFVNYQVVNKHFHVICYPVSLSGKVVVISSSRIGIKALFLFMSCILGRHANKYIFFSGHTTFFLLLSFLLIFFGIIVVRGSYPPPLFCVCLPLFKH